MSVQINAKMVGQLRESTGAGLMDCKKYWSKQRATLTKQLSYCAKGHGDCSQKGWPRCQ